MAARAALALLLALPACASLSEGAEPALAAVDLQGIPDEALAADDECSASGDCALNALQLRARQTASTTPGASNATVEAASDSKAGACLCVFDIDRTLTSSQGSNCPGSKHLPYRDTAYRGGTLVLSPLASAGLWGTFCSQCYLGSCSAGDASGEGSDERRYIADEVLVSNPQRQLHKAFPSSKAYTQGPITAGGQVRSPLVVGQPDGQKQHAIHAIVRWYKKLGVDIPLSQVYLFDDRVSNVAPFNDPSLGGLRAVQISCDSRDASYGNSVGYCGARPGDIVPLPPGVLTSQCH